MPNEAKRIGRPRAVPPKAGRLYVNLSPVVAAEVRRLAMDERRTVTTQIEILLERGLRSYGLEVSAA